MPQIKISTQCERCPREELRVASLEEAVAAMKADPSKAKKELELLIDGKVVVSYSKLCEECRNIVMAYAGGVTKKPKKRSSRRMRRASATKK